MPIKPSEVSFRWLYAASIIFILLMMFISCGRSDMRIGASWFDDGQSFAKFTSYKIEDITDNKNLTFEINSYQSTIQNKFMFRINYDDQYSKLFNQFYFIQEDYNKSLSSDYLRVGGGIGYVPENLNNILEFPFRHKFSLALIFDKAVYPSWRYKINGSILYLTFGYQWDAYAGNDKHELSMSYKIDKHFSVKFIEQAESYSGKLDKTRTLGMEIKL